MYIGLTHVVSVWIRFACWRLIPTVSPRLLQNQSTYISIYISTTDSLSLGSTRYTNDSPPLSLLGLLDLLPARGPRLDLLRRALTPHAPRVSAPPQIYIFLFYICLYLHNKPPFPIKSVPLSSCTSSLSGCCSSRTGACCPPCWGYPLRYLSIYLYPYLYITASFPSLIEDFKTFFLHVVPV